ncbi:MAG: phosphomethylpyrimidine synthase ThiC [Candidatus Omnitrophota bacterium]
MFSKSLLKKIACQEKVTPAFLEKQLSNGRVVIPYNKTRSLAKPCAIGDGLKIKVNTNIGTSTEKCRVQDELKKLKVAIACGTDAVMDLSTGGNLRQVRRRIIDESSVPVGTVPVYEAAVCAQNREGSFEKMDFNDIRDVLHAQAAAGVDFFTVHAGILKSFLKTIKKRKRVCGVVSRGGAILTRWMHIHNKENPFYEHFDDILRLAKEYRIVLSLGDALRPGAIADSTDDLQMSELCVLAELVKRCRKKGVGVMVEGPGHIRLDEIGFNMLLEKRICHRAPFYILGPLPTDIAAGYDHITAAIGGSLAGLCGANFLCVVTPAEHLRHPSIEDIHNGVISAKIAGHCVDLLHFRDEWQRDYQLSLYRAHRNWKKLFPLTIDPEKARSYHNNTRGATDRCSMCGTFCSLKIIDACNFLKKA